MTDDKCKIFVNSAINIHDTTHETHLYDGKPVGIGGFILTLSLGLWRVGLARSFLGLTDAHR